MLKERSTRSFWPPCCPPGIVQVVSLELIHILWFPGLCVVKVNCPIYGFSQRFGKVGRQEPSAAGQSGRKYYLVFSKIRSFVTIHSVHDKFSFRISHFDFHSQTRSSCCDNTSLNMDHFSMIFTGHHGILWHFFQKTSRFLRNYRYF